MSMDLGQELLRALAPRMCSGGVGYGGGTVGSIGVGSGICSSVSTGWSGCNDDRVKSSMSAVPFPSAAEPQSINVPLPIRDETIDPSPLSPVVRTENNCIMSWLRTPTMIMMLFIFAAIVIVSILLIQVSSAIEALGTIIGELLKAK